MPAQDGEHPQRPGGQPLPPVPFAQAGRRLAAAVAESATLTGRCIRLSRRDVEALVMAVVLPLLMMALFVYVFGGALAGRAAYVTYVVPGIVLLCVGFGAASTAPAVAADMTSGMVDRLRSMPIAGSALLTGHVVASVARNAVATAVVLAGALAMGFRPDAGPVEWLAALGLLLLYVLALSWLAAGLGAIASSVQSANALTFAMLFLPYLSSAFVPTETLPGVLRAVAEHQPITPVIEAVRGLLTGTPVGSAGPLALAWCTGLLGGSVLLAVFLPRRRLAE
ncbi:ABC transporter permease [Geodermatophilus sabuli]|uniref:Transport permease protein n=1 Tax=Geodermatophilus sabuli TaxID=1564158 RepID=A0A285EBK5_9ACTN|nr:ABC transporter permease [Geodermatophilus sabuli]MBB3084305.1 ABC-2 type transport system permease protein [Geodermatophilus sabuli]SNX96425.1 ABC-2 type transport system permease protein [Geodermatophilus sabuli]